MAESKIQKLLKPFQPSLAIGLPEDKK